MRFRAHALVTLACTALLVGATEPGLELLQKDGSWLPIQAQHDEIVVDAGDMMQNVTNGIYNVGTGKARSFNDLAKAVIGWHGHGKIQYIPMPDDLQKDLLKQSQNEKFRHAVFRLAALSHLAPVTDRYGYNALVSSPEYVVSDLMLDTTLEWDTSPELLEVRIPVGSATYGLVIDPAASTVILMSLDDRVIISQGKFPEAVNETSGKIQLQVSNFDRQLTIAVNGTQCFEPLALERDPSSENFVEATVSALSGQPMEPDRAALIALKHEQQRRWAFGVVNGTVRVKQLQMFRDVFYTPGRRKHGVNEGYKIPELCYFVQGDNSPVSSDSRNWTNPCVPHSALIGKPFLVHLPSRPGVIEFGGFRWPLRIPDWGRIRYIR